MNKDTQTISDTFNNIISSSLYETLLLYAGSASITLAAIMGDYYLNSEFSISYAPMLFIIPIILSTWVGSYRTGVFSLMMSTIAYHYFYIPLSVYVSIDTVYQVIPLIIFILISLLVTGMLHHARKTDEVSIYKKKNSQYLRQISRERASKEKALAAVKGRDEFLSIASHELKTPLTTSLLQIQMALHNIRNVSLAEFSVQRLMGQLESIQGQTDRLSKMISDLSNVSLITTGRMKLERAEVDLVIVIRNVIKRVTDAERKKDYPITFDAPKTLKGYWDSVRVEQIVINLLTNAIKYGGDKPIAIYLEEKKNRAIIRVKDNGQGIPKNMRQKVFERFERGNDNNGIKGLGVGLYITSQIVRAHNGNIKLKSKNGKGAEFIIELPLNGAKGTANTSN